MCITMQHIHLFWKDDDSGRPQTFREAQFLGDGACNFGCGGITVEIDLVDAVPIHMGATQLQTVYGCRWGEARGVSA